MPKQKRVKARAATAADGLDQVTVLVCDADHSASKRWTRGDGGKVEQVGYNAGTFFGVLVKPVAGIETLSALLLALEGMPNMLVIRGAPGAGLSDAAVRRTKANFKTPEVGRRWVLLDFDKIDLPDGLALQADAPAVVEHLVTLLPEEFHASSYQYQLSSSAGFGDARKVSVHLWYWLTEPWTDAKLKSWAKAVNKRAGYKLVDTALFNDVQAHYTAAPVFENVEDPFPARSGLVMKSADAVSIVFSEEAVEPSPPAAVDSASGPGFEGWLAKIGDHPGGEGFHDPIIRSIASYVTEHGRDGTDAEQVFQSVSKRVIEADRSKHEEDYVTHMASREHVMPAIAGAIAKYGERPASRRPSRLVPHVAPPEPRRSLSREEAQQHLSAAFKRILGTAKV